MALLKKYLEKTPEEDQESACIAVLASLDHIGKQSPHIVKKIIEEMQDQRSHLKMIASENYASLAVQLSMGNWLTDKYAEGFPFHRFYAGCEQIDAIEKEAADLAKEIFHADHAYVQPHSGADANLVAFWSVLIAKVQDKEIEKLGKKNFEALSASEQEKIRKLLLKQKVMGLSLSSGGHLTHGFRHNVSAKIFQAIPYDVNRKTGRIDYDQVRQTARKKKPLILIAGYSAYPRKINFATMREIADEVGAVFMVDMAHFAGLVAGGVFTQEDNPIPYAHIVTSTTHKTLRGPRGGLVLCKEEFKDYVNKGCPMVLGGPLPHVMAAKAVAFREVKRPQYREYAQQVVKNAQALAEEFMRQKVKVLTGGTDNHLLVIDVQKSFGLTGRQAESALREVGITLNRNSIPFDPMGAWYTSGLRIGTPALTTRGMKESEMKAIASFMITTLKAVTPQVDEKGEKSLAKYMLDQAVRNTIQTGIKELLEGFPLYPELDLT